ncbi:hypothetical protein [Amycolatopsis thermoflava]|uniref:hypothetical protein n=1 Tax=Amycolatopsis thermoflava TaxID=84480 RepID=UPI003EB9122D
MRVDAVRAPERSGRRADLVTVVCAGALVAVAVAVGAYLNRPGSGVTLLAPAAPLFGVWLPHAGPGTVLAVMVAFAVVAWGPSLARTTAWRPLLAGSYLAALAWTFALALVDGWQRGLTGRLTNPNEYLREVPGIHDIPAMLRGFTARILDFQPDSWTTHVSGHPPGATLVFEWLDRLGLSGGGWAAVVCVLAGCLAVPAVAVALSALGRADAARATLPFLVLFPGAVWIGASADGLFAGVTAVGIALLAHATLAFRTGRRSAVPAALSGGVVLGFGIFLSYGLVLLGAVALAVAVAGRSLTRTLPLAVAGALAVTGVFALAGFWWLDGYHLVVERYYQGIAAERPYAYWVWANLACLVIASGPAVIAGVRRAVHVRRWRDPVLLLVAGAALAVVLADLSGLSKAETERIWLPFLVWLVPAVSLLPGRRRVWLAGQAVTALAVNHLVLTYW